MRSAAVAWLAGLCLALNAVGQSAPYPPSDVISSVEFDLDSRRQFGLGSDQWPLTLGPDGHLYAGWGDGWGWTRDPDDPKRSMGVTRILAGPDGLRGEDLWGVGPGSGQFKPEALVFVGEKLYLFWTAGDSRYDEDNTKLAISTDRGRTWELGEDRAFPGLPDGFRVRSIAQNGPDDFLYVYFGFNRASDLFLARAQPAKITQPGAYEWFAGDAGWSRDFADKQPAFQDPAGYIWHVGVTYNAGLQRYLLTKPHFAPDDDRVVLNAADSRVASLGVFDAPTPWGPWTTVHYEDNFLDDKVKFSYFVPASYISGDGRELWLAFSGWPEYDNFNLIHCTLQLSKGGGDSPQ